MTRGSWEKNPWSSSTFREWSITPGRPRNRQIGKGPFIKTKPAGPKLESLVPHVHPAPKWLQSRNPCKGLRQRYGHESQEHGPEEEETALFLIKRWYRAGLPSFTHRGSEPSRRGR